MKCNLKEVEEIIEPFLNEVGFEGDFPKYYRVGQRFIELVQVQIREYGHHFFINLSRIEYFGKSDQVYRTTKGAKTLDSLILHRDGCRLVRVPNPNTLTNDEHRFVFEDNNIKEIVEFAGNEFKKVDWETVFQR